jgi:hypothetical protein
MSTSEQTTIPARETTGSSSARTRGDWRNSKWLAVSELVIVALTFVADERHLIPLSKTPFLFAFGWISLWIRKIGWRDVGLKLYRNWETSIAMGIAAGLFLEAIELFVSQPALVRWLKKQPDLEGFHSLHGNLKWTLIALAGT